MPSRAPNLIRRNGVWCFNKAFPKDLWPLTGRAPFRLSLRTESLAEALRMKPEAERRYLAKVDQARLALAASTTAAPVTEAAAFALTGEWFRREVAELEQWLSPVTEERLESALEAAEIELAEARERLALGDTKTTLPLASKLAREAGYRFAPDCPEIRSLARLLLRGRVALSELHKARRLGDYGALPSDALFAAMVSSPVPAAPTSIPSTLPAAAPSPPPRRTLSDLIDAFTADRVASGTKAARLHYAPAFRLAREVLGENRPLDEIKREQGRELFEAGKRLPLHWGRMPGSLSEVLAEADRRELPRISAKTWNDGYRTALSALFTWALREGWMDGRNPVEGLRMVDQVANEERRDPFTIDQLNALLAAEPWSPRDPNPQKMPVFYWGPLLAMFMGFRRGEICALRVQDVEEVEGRLTIHVRRSLKTQAARRSLPVHSAVIGLGFKAFVEQRRREATPDEPLFPGEQQSANDKWGRKLGEFMAARVQALGLSGRKLGMHSFRHNVEDRLREAGLHGTALGAEIMGRARGRDMVADAYGRGFSIATLADAIERIQYPGLVLPPAM